MTTQSHIYELENLPRNLDFPYSLSQVGWMVCHNSPVQTLKATFVCISFNRRQYSQEAPAEAIISVLYPGTRTTMQNFVHDEIFFSYRPDYAQRINELLKGESFFRQPFTFSSKIAALCADLHERLMRLHEPDMVDNLDMHALQIINSCVQAVRNYTAPTASDDMRIYEIAARLKQGDSLDALIRKYNFGRRTFYYAWNRIFKISPSKFRQDEMLKQAALLLQQTTMSVAEIASNCGFANETCLYRLFKLKHHLTPTQYRKQQYTLL